MTGLSYVPLRSTPAKQMTRMEISVYELLYTLTQDLHTDVQSTLVLIKQPGTVLFVNRSNFVKKCIAWTQFKTLAADINWCNTDVRLL